MIAVTWLSVGVVFAVHSVLSSRTESRLLSTLGKGGRPSTDCLPAGRHEFVRPTRTSSAGREPSRVLCGGRTGWQLYRPYAIRTTGDTGHSAARAADDMGRCRGRTVFQPARPPVARATGAVTCPVEVDWATVHGVSGARLLEYVCGRRRGRSTGHPDSASFGGIGGRVASQAHATACGSLRPIAGLRQPARHGTFGDRKAHGQ